MSSSLDLLKQHTTIVADTGDFEQLEKYKPQDSTTNPSLLLAAAQLPQYQRLVADAVSFGKSHGETLAEQTERAMDKLAVNFGIEILKIVPGRVSTEIDARLSYDTEGTVKKGRELISLYKEAGIDSDRILLKIASTWEGLEAARILEAEGLHVNMTLLFCLEQAAVAGANDVTLISPFAGRITDFYKQRDGVNGYPPEEDPGVLSVRNIYNYIRKFGFKTVVMGASFRTAGQVKALAGCDLLTVSPQLLAELKDSDEDVPSKLNPEEAAQSNLERMNFDSASFKISLCENEMAYLKLGEGIRRFAADIRKLEAQVEKLLTE